MKKLALVLAVMFIAATAFAYPGMGKPGAGAAPAPPKYKIQMGQPMVDFELKDMADQVVKSADLRKDKVFIFRFTASTHRNAEMQVAHIKKAMAKYGDKIAVIDIAVKEPLAKEALEAYYKGQGKDWATVLDTDGAIADKYGASAPSIIIAGKDGKIVGQGQFVPWFQLEPALDEILGMKKAE